jgi:predicted nucleotidyltransferase
VKTDNQEIKSLINEISTSAQETFGTSCTAAYIMGSLARGGFSEIASDIDIGVILSGDIQESDLANIQNIKTTSVKKHKTVKNNVSIFWGNIESINGVVDAGRYPPFDRLDLIDHALLLSGVDIRNELIKPTKEELEIASADFALGYLGSNERINEFYNCELISNKGAVYVTKTILFPARFIYLEKTGEIAGNDASHQYYVDNFSGNDAELVRNGYQWRLNSLPQELSRVTDLLNEGLIELYHKFIDIYAERMGSYGQYELQSRLIEWKQKITKPSI